MLSLYFRSEANNIVSSGKGVSPKSHFDRDLYNEEDHDDAAINLEFLDHILKEAHKSYSSHIDYNCNEDAFNQLFVWPYLSIIAKSVTIEGCNSDFIQSHPCLESMSRQLKAVVLYVDDKNQYKSDGLIKLFGLDKLELLLLETSGSFSNKDKNKVKLDTELHFWSVCYQNGGVFDLWREANVQIKPEFQNRGDFLPDLAQFCWKVKCELNESMRNIIALKEEHNIEKPSIDTVL
ncbi:hypothetical protein G6F43_010813 [Rhizopus delemar]|nr:hypothetical protein G6F43_010813 [Rhizopus delemar]